MSEMEITSAQYLGHFEFSDRYRAIEATIDGVVISVPLDPANRHYAEIMRQVGAGELTIQEATD